jgi:hypothetical protein
VKHFAQGICVLIAAALLGACGAGGEQQDGTASAAPPLADTTLTLDMMAWDQAVWAD